VYLTDTTTETGAHSFLPGTQRVESCEPLMRRKAEELGIDYKTIRATVFEAPNDCYGNDDLYEAVFGEIKLTVEGPAGLAFLEDNSGLHKGIPPRSEPRLCFWARFGIGQPDWTGVFPRDWKKFVARSKAGFPPHPELDGILVDDRTAHVLRFINRDIHLDLAFE